MDRASFQLPTLFFHMFTTIFTYNELEVTICTCEMVALKVISLILLCCLTKTEVNVGGMKEEVELFC